MKYKIQGIVKVIGELERFPSGFQKKQIVLSAMDGKYEQLVPIDFVKDSVEKLNGISVGDEVTVDFNLRGNEYSGKYFCNLDGWKVSVHNTASTEQAEPF